MPTQRQEERTRKRKAGKQEAVKYADLEKGKEAGRSNCEVGRQEGMRLEDTPKRLYRKGNERT